jgi:hypothetical protein
MNLQEQISRIKSMMGVVNEQKPDNLMPGQIERFGYTQGKPETLKPALEKQSEYFKLISKLKPESIKKVRLIFPEDEWEEFAVRQLEKLGIVTGAFKSLHDAKNFINDLSKKNVKADEFVIGSHGSAGNLLITQEEGDFAFDNSFLTSFKTIIHPGTKVFFTACEGADYLDTLKDAAEKLGIGVYGAAGIYVHFINVSEKGFYWCSPNQFTPPKSKDVPPYDFWPTNEASYLSFNILTKEELPNFPVTITIKNGVFDKPVSPLKITSTTKENKRLYYSSMRDDLIFNRHYIEPRWEITNYFTLPNTLLKMKETESNNIITRKEKELGKKYIGAYIREKIDSNEIIIELEINNKRINFKNLPKVVIPGDITNEFLLEKGLCKKVSSSPISWI